MCGRCTGWRRPGRLRPAEADAILRRRDPWQVFRWESETSPASLSNAYELLMRTMVAQGEQVEGCQTQMEEIATVAEERPAVLVLVHEGNEWRRAA